MRFRNSFCFPFFPASFLFFFFWARSVLLDLLILVNNVILYELSLARRLFRRILD